MSRTHTLRAALLLGLAGLLFGPSSCGDAPASKPAGDDLPSARPAPGTEESERPDWTLPAPDTDPNGIIGSGGEDGDDASDPSADPALVELPTLDVDAVLDLPEFQLPPPPGEMVPATSCPTAVAVARIAESGDPWRVDLQVQPLAIIELDGSESFGQRGIATWRWFVLDAPDSAGFVALDRADEPLAQLFIPVAGDYQLGLEVFDGQQLSCEMAIINIVVVHTSDIVVELTWDTPGDQIAYDIGAGAGSDMDLHFVHPNGVWNSAPWDCFWQNKEPNWGSAQADDNPSLDIDDTDGWGPEQMRLDLAEGTPENPVTYSVGVFYFSDHGFGPSDARVRIFIDGVLRLESVYEGLGSRQFWDVARIEWPSGEIERINTLHPSGFP